MAQETYLAVMTTEIVHEVEQEASLEGCSCCKSAEFDQWESKVVNGTKKLSCFSMYDYLITDGLQERL